MWWLKIACIRLHWLTDSYLVWKKILSHFADNFFLFGFSLWLKTSPRRSWHPPAAHTPPMDKCWAVRPGVPLSVTPSLQDFEMCGAVVQCLLRAATPTPPSRTSPSWSRASPGPVARRWSGVPPAAPSPALSIYPGPTTWRKRGSSQLKSKFLPYFRWHNCRWSPS